MNKMHFAIFCGLFTLTVTATEVTRSALALPSIPFEKQEALTQLFASWSTYEKIGDEHVKNDNHMAALTNYLKASLSSLETLLLLGEQRRPYCSTLFIENTQSRCEYQKGSTTCESIPETIQQCAGTKKLCDKTFRERKSVAKSSRLHIFQETPCIPLNGHQLQL